MLGAAAAELAGKVIPLGRVWSFPKEIVIAKPGTCRTYLVATDAIYRDKMVEALTDYYDKQFIANLKARTQMLNLCARITPLPPSKGVIIQEFYSYQLHTGEA